MAEEQKRRGRKPRESTEHDTSPKKGKKVESDKKGGEDQAQDAASDEEQRIRDISAQIDDLIEENSEEFVKAYKQKGGE